MIIAVTVVDVVQAAVNKVVDVVAMWHRLVPAARPMHMGTAGLQRCALLGVGGTHFNHVFVIVIAVRVMQMAIVQVVDVAIVAYRNMPATGAVLVIIVLMGIRARHGAPLYR